MFFSNIRLTVHN